MTVRCDRLSRKPERLQVVNGMSHLPTSENPDPRSPIYRVFYYRHPRAKANADASAAIPTRFKIQLTDEGFFEAEPQTILESFVDDEPGALTIERVLVTEQRLYLMKLIGALVSWPQAQGLWSQYFNVSETTMKHRTIEGMVTFESGDLDRYWHLAEELARTILGLHAADTLEQGFWEMNDLINEAQRPGHDMVAMVVCKHFFAIRGANPRYLARLGGPQASSTACSDQIAQNASSAFDSTTNGSVQESHQSPSPEEEQQHSEISLESLAHRPNPEDILFLARFPIPKDMGKSLKPPLRVKNRLDPLSLSCKNIEPIQSESGKKRKKRKKRALQNSSDTEATTLESTSNGEVPIINTPQAESCPSELCQTALQSPSLNPQYQQIPAALDAPSVAASVPQNTIQPTPESSVMCLTPTTSHSSPRLRESAHSDQPVQTVVTPNKSPNSQSPTKARGKADTNSLETLKGFSLENSTCDSPHRNLVHDESDPLSSSRDSSKATDAKHGSSEVDNSGAQDPRNGSFCIEKLGDIEFVYCTWKGLAQARQGVSELAKIFGTEWVERGTLLYAIHEDWQLATIA